MILLAGPFVLVGRKPAVASPERLIVPPRMTAQGDTPQSWLVLAHEEPTQTKLADQWTRLLQEQGDIGSVLVITAQPNAESGFDPATVTAVEAAVVHSQAQFGTLRQDRLLGWCLPRSGRIHDYRKVSDPRRGFKGL
jgi:hypothetical protein